MAIARSHAIVGNVANALALIDHAHDLIEESASTLPDAGDVSEETALNVEVSPDATEFLQELLDGELQRHRAIVHIENLRKESRSNSDNVVKAPLIERLHEYPSDGVDLSNIVQYPPKLALIPAKPIFLDVAWNYIEYPGRGATTEGPAKQTTTSTSTTASTETTPAPQQPKRSWFGFGRS